MSLLCLYSIFCSFVGLHVDFWRCSTCKGVMYLSNIYVSSISSNGKYSCIIIVYKLCLCECTKVCETMRRA